MIASMVRLVHMAVVLQTGAATVSGVVRDESTGEPIVGARVAISDLRRATPSTAGGHFKLARVPVGMHHLTVRRLGYASRALDVIVPSEGAVVNVSLRPTPLELSGIEVRPRIPVRGDDQVDAARPFSGTVVSSRSLENHPLLAEPDALEGLVGGEVVTRPEAPTGLHVRGGAADQVAFLLDGVPVLSPYHPAGSFTAWNPDAIGRVELRSMPPLTRGPAALTGAVIAETRNPTRTPRFAGAVTTTQARLTADGTIPLNETHFLLSGRAVGWLAGSSNGATSRRGGSDVIAKLESPLLGGRLRALEYENRNDVRTSSTAQDGGDGAGGAETAAPLNRFAWLSRSTGLTWTGPFPGGASLRLQGWRATGTASADWITGDTTAETLGARRIDHGVLAALEWSRGTANTSIGVRLDRSRTNYRVGSGRSSPAAPYRLDGGTAVFTGFLEQVRPLGARVRTSLGLRASWTDGEPYLGPHAAIRWNAAESLDLEAAFARTFQFAQSLRNPESVLGFSFPADLFVSAGAPGVPVARGDQFSATATLRPTAGVRLGALAYTREADGLVLVAAATGAPFAVRDFATGSGTARGGALDFTISRARYAVTANYGLENVRFTYRDTTYVPDFAATHLVHAGILTFPTATASLRAGVTAVWDRRSSAVVGPFDWDSCTSAVRGCDFSGSPGVRAEPLGATRLPAYLRLDLGARKNWHVRLGTGDAVLSTFVSIRDVLGQANARVVSLDVASGSREWVEVTPRAPLVFGIDWRF